ncbi:MAG: YafY family transcriptional regulator [Acidobacteria bacterium]|nr:YafY family transcriptional regulator [Acidobacteriota bacterium]
MRADRLISILLLLQIHTRITARALAERLEVSERTILRDMEALSIAGIPVFAERGTGGGWSLTENYRTNLTGLNEAEVQALFLTRPARLLADLGLAKAADGAQIKLLAAIPANARHNAEQVSQRIYVDVAGWQRADEAVPCLPVIQEAVWQERKLRISYQRGGGGDECGVERIVEPLGLVAKGSVWYLLAAIDDAIRNYRVSRVRIAELLDEGFVRPADFDLAATWQQSNVEFKAKFPRYPVTLRVHPDALWRLQFAGRFASVEHVGKPEADGRITVQMNYQVAENACGNLIGLGAQVEIVEPVELREMLVALARSVLAFYTLIEEAK